MAKVKYTIKENSKVATTIPTRTDNGKKSRADVWSARFFFVPSQA